jgi:hypothetical protein
MSEVVGKLKSISGSLIFKRHLYPKLKKSFGALNSGKMGILSERLGTK